MNRSEEDILREYIDHDRVEKAPENFTQTVLTRIRLESESRKVTGKLRNFSLIPLASVIITLILIILASVLPGSTQESSPLVRLFQNIDFPVLEINFDKLNIELPVWITYTCVGILLIGVFDRVLWGLFNRY